MARKLPSGETVAEWTEREQRLAYMLELVWANDPSQIERIEGFLEKTRAEVAIHLLRIILNSTIADARELQAQKAEVTLLRLREELGKKHGRRSLASNR